MLLSSSFDLPWWGYAAVLLALTHVTIVSVTVYLHRCQAHRALDLHPVVSHFFRFWLWLTTGMVTKEWAAVHRKHHAKCETTEDPHSPQIYGLNRVLWFGVFLYVDEAHNGETIQRYGRGTPDDWIERNLYSGRFKLGLVLMGALDVMLFDVAPGMLMLIAQIIWIPFWAAGVINGVGHFFGYRSWDSPDASKNIFPVGILIGGEELHNNHHAFASAAKLSNKWYEFDIGWLYIRLLSALRLATVKKVPPAPRFKAKRAVDAETLHSVIANRYDVLAKYAKSLKLAYVEELRELRRMAPHDAAMLRRLRHWITRDENAIPAEEKAELDQVLAKTGALQKIYEMRRDLVRLWERSNASREQLVRELQDWCSRAEGSGVRQLVEFSRRLRCYA